MSQGTYLITFEEIAPAEASRYADELRDDLLNAGAKKVERRRSDPRAQDFGTTLVLVLGTPAAVAVATALGNWLGRRHGSKLTIRMPDGEIILENVSSKDAMKVVEYFRLKG